MTDDRHEAEGHKAQHQQVKESLARVVNGVVGGDAHPTGLDALVRNYWPVLAALVAVAVAWGVSTAQIASVGSAVSRLDGKIDVFTDQVAGVKASSQYNDREIADLRDRVWKLEAKR